MLQSLVLKTLISLELNCLSRLAYRLYMEGDKSFYSINNQISFYIKNQNLFKWFWYIPGPLLDTIK